MHPKKLRNQYSQIKPNPTAKQLIHNNIKRQKMVSYKELGLVNTREMFAKAIKGGYAIPAFNFNNMEQLQAIIKAASETKSPVILQVSKGARNYANATLLRYMAQGAVEYAKELGWANPQIVLHLDHGDSFELCKSCIDLGFSSVMIDGSHLPYEENVALTKKVCDYAHQYDVTVEGNSAFSPVLKTKFLQTTTLTQTPKKLSTSLLAQVATHSPSQSAPATAHTNSLPNSAHSMPTANSFLPPWHSMFSTPLWKSFPDSPSCFTAHRQFPKTKLTPSTNSAANFLTPSASPKKNSAKPQNQLFAKSTSTLTHVSL